MEDAKQKAKDRILYLLKMQGAQTATALAEQLQVSPMAIRQHLQNLQTEGWVIYQEERRPLGRPVKLWQLAAQVGGSVHFVSPKENRLPPRFPDSHADLMVDLLKSVESVFGEAGLDQLVTERSQRQVQSYQAKLDGGTWQQRVRAIAQLRTQEGYMAEVIDLANGALLLVENHCPICAAAQTCQKLCGAELAVFQAVLGGGMTVERVEHILMGDRRCAYRISP
jgi:predicted ArsR family transcriptional regulator